MVTRGEKAWQGSVKQGTKKPGMREMSVVCLMLGNRSQQKLEEPSQGGTRMNHKSFHLTLKLHCASSQAEAKRQKHPGHSWASGLPRVLHMSQTKSQSLRKRQLHVKNPAQVHKPVFLHDTSNLGHMGVATGSPSRLGKSKDM